MFSSALATIPFPLPQARSLNRSEQTLALRCIGDRADLRAALMLRVERTVVEPPDHGIALGKKRPATAHGHIEHAVAASDTQPRHSFKPKLA